MFLIGVTINEPSIYELRLSSRFLRKIKLFCLTLCVVTFALDADAQERIDPVTIVLSQRNLQIFKGDPERLISFYTATLRGFSQDGERLNLSTLDAWIALQTTGARGRFIGGFLGYDLDWDGGIDRAEYNSVFPADFLLGEGISDHWEQGAASNDLNGDDVITVEELLFVAEQGYSAERSVDSEIHEMRNWDLDRDGFVDTSEVSDVIIANTK